MANIINSLAFGTGTYVITLPYATCNTAAGTQAKVATLTPNTNWSLETGSRVSVKFDAANSASSPTLNVNQSGAKTIRFRGAALTSSLFYWAAGSVVDFVYDGTYWNMTGSPHNYDSNTTYTFNGAVSTIKDSNLTASRALVSDANGKVAVSAVTSTELGYLDGVTSSVQTQLNGKASSSHTHVSLKGNTDDRSSSTTPDDYNGVFKVAGLKTNTAIGLSASNTYSGVVGFRQWSDSSGGKSHELAFNDDGLSMRMGATTTWEGWQKFLTDTNFTVSNSAPTLSWGATSTIATVGGTALTVTMPSNPNSNTYGRSANTASKIYLMGTLEQSASNKTSYSNVSCYASGGYLYSGGTKVSVEGHTHTFTDTNTSHSHTAGTGLTVSGSGGTSGTTTYSANLNSTTSLGTIGTTSKLYAVGVDANGQLCVNVPWTDNNTDTKVTQAAAITATTSANYPVMLGYSTATTAVTNTLNKSAKLLFNTGTGALTVGSGSSAGSGTLTVDGDIVAGGGSDNYGIHPKTSNYSTLGKSNKYWYKVYSANVYTNSLKKLDGTDYSFTMTWNTF